MAFVVYALEEVFEMDTDAASELMLRVHNEGKAACESYPFDEASKNAAAVIDARPQEPAPAAMRRREIHRAPGLERCIST